MVVSDVNDTLAYCFSDGLEDLLVSPVTAPLEWYSRVPALEYRRYAAVYTLPYVYRLNELEKMSQNP